MDRERLVSSRMLEREAQLPSTKMKEQLQLNLEHGLESAESVRDRTIPLFNRLGLRFHHGGTFAARPFLRDMRELDGQDVAIVGAPFDGGTTYRPGARFGPRAIRAMTALDSGYNLEIEKTFDQIDKAVGYIHERAVFPVVLGGDHSIGYPDIRGLASRFDGNVGIIHFDRHFDLSEYNYDERMHGTPFFHATNIPNAPASNLVQIGIGGWNSNRAGTAVARERNTTVITMTDIDRWGVERMCEMALENAWRGAKAVFLSFDIDCVDPGYAPGTGTPEPGGFTPREVFRMLGLIAREGLIGMEVVEVAPEYDVGEITSLLGTRVIYTVLGTLINEGKLGTLPDATITSDPVTEATATDEGIEGG